MEGYDSKKVESHDWLKEEEEAPSAQETQEKGVQVPKDLQCPLCSEYLQPHPHH